MNEVIVRGRITHIFENLKLDHRENGEEFVTGMSCITVSTPRDKNMLFVPNEDLGANKENNNIQFYFFGENAPISKSFNRGDYVEAKGKVVMRFVKEKNAKKSHPDQSIHGVDIKIIKTEMSEVFDKNLGGGFNLENAVFLSGTVDFINKKNGIVHIGLKPEGQKNALYLNYFTKSPDSAIKQYSVGDTIYTKCELQSNVSEKDGLKNRYERLVIKYIDKDYSHIMPTSSYGQVHRFGRGLVR